MSAAPDPPAPSIVWLRQDLRLADQRAFAAASEAGPVIALYVLDDDAPGEWRIGGAQRWWLHHSLASLSADLAQHGVQLLLRRGDAVAEVANVAREAGATAVHALHHFEPWWQAAEARLADRVDLHLHGGTHLADPRDVLTGAGGRYRMFTPFWRALQDRMPPPRPRPIPSVLTGAPAKLVSDGLADWALLPTAPDWSTNFAIFTPGEAGAAKSLKTFGEQSVKTYLHDRNFPALVGTSSLSPHLHFGELSPAQVWHAMPSDAAPFLREIAWRDFTANVIDILPDYAESNGRSAYDRLEWRTGAAADRDFAAWTKGRTGYPIVDAGMRQLWAIGWMHNRVRMITASFLVKHLLIDWRRGERWFWDTLIDADYGNNSVNWQWIAGTGIDSNPFGRIMAPLTQSTKFEAGDYIRKWVPELAGLSDDAIHDPHANGAGPAPYPKPLIGHREARERALAAAAKVR